ncbi:MAG: Regulator of chromosome condensation repeat, partial [Bacteroidota bacterium]
MSTKTKRAFANALKIASILMLQLIVVIYVTKANLQASAGFSHALIIKNGKVFAWGNNDHGQLGNGTRVNSITPV